MPTTSFTTTIPAASVSALLELLAEEKKEGLAGLAERARNVGYFRERMWLQPRANGDSQLIVFLEYEESTTAEKLIHDVVAYDSEFTRWWNPRYIDFLGGPPKIAEEVLAWDDNQRKQ